MPNRKKQFYCRHGTQCTSQLKLAGSGRRSKIAALDGVGGSLGIAISERRNSIAGAVRKIVEQAASRIWTLAISKKSEDALAESHVPMTLNRHNQQVRPHGFSQVLNSFELWHLVLGLFLEYAFSSQPLGDRYRHRQGRKVILGNSPQTWTRL